MNEKKLQRFDMIHSSLECPFCEKEVILLMDKKGIKTMLKTFKVGMTVGNTLLLKPEDLEKFKIS